MQSDLAPFPGCQVSCVIVRNGSGGSVASFNVHPGLEVLPCSLDTDLNCEIIMLQLYQGVSESKFWR